jgi:hypothetical protein
MSEPDTKTPKKMEEKVSKAKYKVPSPNIYKAYILDKAGEISYILVFCSNTLDHDDLFDIFSETQITYFESKRIEIMFCDSLLFKDDTVHMVKSKMMIMIRI